MKTIITSALFVILFIANIGKPCLAQQTSPTTSATATTPHKLTVIISNVNNRTGKLYIGLATSQANFMGETPQRKAVDVTPSGELTATFDNLAPGKYAVRVFQDLNDNKKMDFSGQMPSEPFGFSNISMLMGPPSFDESAFDLDEDKLVRVRMMEL